MKKEMLQKIDNLLWSIAGIAMGLAIIAPIWVLISMIIILFGE